MSDVISKKVYIEIVKKIREIIETDQLKPGDKIPSERELAERLHAGRSSVREALRALELLGLIETRRGEGTFLRDASGNQLVQVLGTFVLQDDKARKDVRETKYLIELDCLRLVSLRNNDERLIQLKHEMENTQLSDGSFFDKLASIADNFLLYRIWNILNDYYYSLQMKEKKVTKEYYLSLIDALLQKNLEEAIRIYKKIRNI